MSSFWAYELPQVCCSVFLCVALPQVCCSVLQCVAVCCSVLQCVAVRCSVLKCVAVCYSLLQCVAVWCSVLQCVAVRCSVLQCVAVCCSVKHCVAMCCRIRVAVHCSTHDGKTQQEICTHHSGLCSMHCCDDCISVAVSSHHITSQRSLQHAPALRLRLTISVLVGCSVLQCLTNKVCLLQRYMNV